MIDKGSFRDPSGYIFKKGDQIFRAINYSYKEDYDHLISSGLYSELADKGLLISHSEMPDAGMNSSNIYKLIKPEKVKFISYPYEWSFSQLKDAALATLEIQDIALGFGMSLKDSSAFNIQFHNGKPLLIDTLSFEKYEEGKPWIAYKQFCQHFLAPLALMGYKDYRLNQLLRIYIDGIPLDLANSLLPSGTKLKPGIMMHISMHSKFQKKYSDNKVKVAEKEKSFSLTSIKGLILNLRNTVESIKLKGIDTEWGNYYETSGHSKDYTEHKKAVVDSFIAKATPSEVWDLGANNGFFSRLASDRGINTVAFDIDALGVERNYLEVRSKKEARILPLLMDLTNPSPGIGWSNSERKSLSERGPADLVIALALIHHLAISNNLPFDRIAEFLSQVCRWLVIEFVPKEDEKVRILLKNRKDVFTNYNQQSFEEQFKSNFSIVDSVTLSNSSRILYLMKRKDKQ
jgi:hypothetical protein